jgi:UDP-N-acetyl-D-glucosamine dehydrogenase
VKTVGIIGQGYVGLAIADAAASAGHKVIGFDSNIKLIANLTQGLSHIEDVSVVKLKELITSKQYTPTSDSEDLGNCEIIIIAVPTPLDQNRYPDLKHLKSAVDTISNVIKKEILIINESTSYPGTLREEIAEKIYIKTRINHRYASAPERIDPGNTKWNIKNTTRIVAGLDSNTTQEVKEFYLTFTESVKTVSSPEVAEMSKLVENSFRQVNIAFVNELAQISHSFGINIDEVLSAAETKPYGFMRFNPGAGVGGHCIPVDPTYLSYKSKQQGIEATFIERANQVNLLMPEYIVSRVLSDHNNNIAGKSVLVVGVAYKANVSDVRETPATAVIQGLKKANANVKWHDPLVSHFENQNSQEISDQDIAVILTLHDQVNLDKLRKIFYVFDCTGKLDWAKKL